MRSYIRIATPTVLLALAGCSGLPDRVDSLEQARQSISTLEREPLAGRVAAAELGEARDALASADRAYEDREELEVVEHYAYVAQRHADISRELLGEAKGREEVERAEAERNRIIADARTREAAAAQLAAENATRELDVQAKASEEQALLAQLVAETAEERARALERELEELKMDAKNTDRGLVLTLGDVLFDTGAAALKPGAAPTIDRLAQFMRDYPERSVRIEGHTDSAGSDVTNQTLSEQRAEAVRRALIERNLEAARITTLGYGEARPIAGNESAGRTPAEPARRNRRIR